MSVLSVFANCAVPLPLELPHVDFHNGHHHDSVVAPEFDGEYRVQQSVAVQAVILALQTVSLLGLGIIKGTSLHLHQPLLKLSLFQAKMETNTLRCKIVSVSY